jgi:hypothetical protein
MKILRVLGFKDFLRFDEIVNELISIDSTQDFSNKQYMLFIKTPMERLWMIGSRSHIYFVYDNGTEISVIQKIEKATNKDIAFDTVKGEKYAKMVFKDLKKSIPFDLAITGGTTTTTTTFKQFLNE